MSHRQPVQHVWLRLRLSKWFGFHQLGQLSHEVGRAKLLQSLNEGLLLSHAQHVHGGTPLHCALGAEPADAQATTHEDKPVNRLHGCDGLFVAQKGDDGKARTAPTSVPSDLQKGEAATFIR